MLDTFEILIQGLLEKGFGSVDNWFTPRELNCLRQSLLRQYDENQFHQAGVGNKSNFQTFKAIRNDQIFWLNQDQANDCEQQFFTKVDAFAAYLNRTCYAGIRSFEFHYAIYEKGTFYKKHIDQFKNDDRRVFSVVFYLTEDWQPGDGGELVIYLTDQESVKVEPRSGRMIFFRSDLPHEVLMSHQKRLSLTGWMRSI